MDRPPVSDVLIGRRLKALEKNLPAARKGNVDALHHARVASRRIREVLPLLRAGGRVRRLERDVRRITRALGPVRELDVALQILDEMEQAGAASRPAVTRLRQALARERQMLHVELKRRIDRCNLGKLRKRALGAARTFDDRPRARGESGHRERARRLVARRAARLRSAIEAAAGIYLPDRLHDVRIAVKKLRYALELAREIRGPRGSGGGAIAGPPKAVAARIRTLQKAQDLLGRMHDLEVLIARTRAVQGAPGAPTLRLSAELDLLVRRFETDCRQLHARYMGLRRGLLDVCDQSLDGAAARSSADVA